MVPLTSNVQLEVSKAAHGVCHCGDAAMGDEVEAEVVEAEAEEVVEEVVAMEVADTADGKADAAAVVSCWAVAVEPSLAPWLPRLVALPRPVALPRATRCHALRSVWTFA